MVLTTFIKYLLHSIDLQSENPWDNKAVYMLYTELFTGASFSITNLLYSTEFKMCYRDHFSSSVFFLTMCVQFKMKWHQNSNTRFYSRFHQGAPVHRLHDHYDKGPHLPLVCHSPHVSGYEVSHCMLCLFACRWFICHFHHFAFCFCKL